MPTPLLSRIGRLTCLSLISIQAQLVYAQPSLAGSTDNNQEARWFQVEIAIFSQGSPSQTDTEYWRRDLALAYPPNWVALKAAEPEAVLPEVTPENGEQPGQTQADDIAPDLVSDVNRETESQNITLEDEDSALAGQAETHLTSTPKPSWGEIPYTFLDPAEHQLQAEVDALARDKHYRVLFHQAWRQPMVKHAQAPALLISAGDNYNQHRELEGTLTLSVSRYLHLHTNLWLSQFEANYGQQSKPWPELPTPPNARTHLIEPGGTTDTTHFSEQQDPIVRQGWQLPLEATPTESTIAIDTDKLFSSSTDRITTNSQLDLSHLLTDKTYENILKHPYLVSHVSTLVQKRRMRSKELHYIDHPHLGLLIKIVPYELPADTALQGTEMPIDSDSALPAQLSEDAGP